MGKLKDLRAEYIKAPIGSIRERELVEEIEKITKSKWWDENVGKPFILPKKGKSYMFGYGEEFVHIGNFIIHKDDMEWTIRLLTTGRID